MPSSPGSAGLARAHPLTKGMEPSRQTWSSHGLPYPLGRWSSDSYLSLPGVPKACLHTPHEVFVGFVFGLWASIRPMNDYLLQNMGQVFVRWTNILSSRWGKYSFLGRIPAPAHGAGIRPTDEYPLQHSGAGIRSPHGLILSPAYGANIRPRTNTLAVTRGQYSPTDEYPCRNMGQRIRPPTNNVSETWDEHFVVIRIGQTVRIVARILPVDKYNRRYI